MEECLRKRGLDVRQTRRMVHDRSGMVERTITVKDEWMECMMEGKEVNPRII